MSADARVRGVLDGIAGGEITSEREVAEALGDIALDDGSLHAVLGCLERGEPDDRSSALFLRTASFTDAEPARSWAIVLGSVRAGPSSIEPLARFAREPEMAGLALPPLLGLAEREPRAREVLVSLAAELPSDEGAAELLATYVSEEAWLASDVPTAAAILGAAMRGPGRTATAVPLAAIVNADLFARAHTDDATFESIAMLVSSILHDAHAPDVAALRRALEHVYRPYVGLLRQRRADVRLIAALVGLATFFAHDASEGVADHAYRRREIDELLETRMNVETVRLALAQPATRSLALFVIDERPLRELLDDVRRLHDETGDAHAALVLSNHADA